MEITDARCVCSPLGCSLFVFEGMHKTWGTGSGGEERLSHDEVVAAQETDVARPGLDGMVRALIYNNVWQ
jgi:hypothetical protein